MTTGNICKNQAGQLTSSTLQNISKSFTPIHHKHTWQHLQHCSYQLTSVKLGNIFIIQTNSPQAHWATSSTLFRPTHPRHTGQHLQHHSDQLSSGTPGHISNTIFYTNSPQVFFVTFSNIHTNSPQVHLAKFVYSFRPTELKCSLQHFQNHSHQLTLSSLGNICKTIYTNSPQEHLTTSSTFFTLGNIFIAIQTNSPQVHLAKSSALFRPTHVWYVCYIFHSSFI